MSDIVATAIEDLMRRVRTVQAVQTRVVYMYTQDELLDLTRELSIPCVGVLYGGLNLAGGALRREVAHDLTCAIVLLGADLCVHDARSQLSSATEILQSIRDAVRTEPASATEMKWVFVSEIPIELGNNTRPLMGYVQRWSTNVVLWP